MVRCRGAIPGKIAPPRRPAPLAVTGRARSDPARPPMPRNSRFRAGRAMALLVVRKRVIG